METDACPGTCDSSRSLLYRVWFFSFLITSSNVGAVLVLNCHWAESTCTGYNVELLEGVDNH